MIHRLTEAISHNSTYVLEAITAWVLVIFGNIVGRTVEHPVIVDVLPYVQLVSLILASCASIYTIYKIRKDLNK